MNEIQIRTGEDRTLETEHAFKPFYAHLDKFLRTRKMTDVDRRAISDTADQANAQLLFIAVKVLQSFLFDGVI